MGLHDTGVKEFAAIPSYVAAVAKKGDAKLTHRTARTFHQLFLAMAKGTRSAGEAALARKYVGALRKAQPKGVLPPAGPIQRYIDELNAALGPTPGRTAAPKRRAARKTRTRRGK